MGLLKEGKKEGAAGSGVDLEKFFSSFELLEYSNKLEKSVAILQCYVAHIYSAPGPGSFTVAEASGSLNLNLQTLPR